VGGISILVFNTKCTRECRPHFAACGTPDRASDTPKALLSRQGKGHTVAGYGRQSTRVRSEDRSFVPTCGDAFDTVNTHYISGSMHSFHRKIKPSSQAGAPIDKLGWVPEKKISQWAE
jgi:hypothetical protein